MAGKPGNPYGRDAFKYGSDDWAAAQRATKHQDSYKTKPLNTSRPSSPGPIPTLGGGRTVDLNLPKAESSYGSTSAGSIYSESTSPSNGVIFLAFLVIAGVTVWVGSKLALHGVFQHLVLGAFICAGAALLYWMRKIVMILIFVGAMIFGLYAWLHG
jgi:hypothetical protein